MSTFSYAIKKTDGALELSLKGAIDENATFPTLELQGVEALVVDFQGINHLNSLGIQRWVHFISKIRSERSEIEIIYQNCPRNVVQQINTVGDFIPEDARVASFFVPYYCEECSHDESIIYREGQEINGDEVTYPEVVCPECKEPMEPDIMPKNYFSFLKAA